MSSLHTYSMRVVLAKLKDGAVPSADKGEELGEVLAFNTKYALNSIPKATVSLPVGDKISKEGLTPSYVNKVDFKELADNNIPVGIYIKAYGYNTNTEILPEKEICVFKGYIESCSYNRGENSASVTLQLAHWLQLLTIFPLVNTMVDPKCVGTIGRSYGISVSQKFASKTASGLSHPFLSDRNDKRTAFTFLKGAFDAMKDLGSSDIWSVLKSILVDGMPRGEEIVSTDPGHVSEELFNQIQYVLAAIKGKRLEWDAPDLVAGNGIKSGICNYLASLTEQQLSSQTPWDAMIGSILPSFYMALIPMVDCASVVPIPGQCMNADNCLSLTYNDYRSISYNRNARPIIGGVVLYFQITQDGGQKEGLPQTAYRYPLKNNPGPFQFITAPLWINAASISSSANQGQTTTGFYSHFTNDQTNLKEKSEQQDKEIDEEQQKVPRLLKKLVRSAYQVLSCQGRSCVIVLPFRVDITPGSQIKVIAADVMSQDGKESYLYGTVAAVNLVISPSTADTVIELTNLRTEAEMEDSQLTSKTGVLFKDAWHHEEGKLYV